MILPRDRTLTDSDTTKEVGWRLSPLHLAPVVVAPPSDKPNSEIREYHFDDASQFSLLEDTQVGLISDAIFDLITEESMLEHGDIWRRLADL